MPKIKHDYRVFIYYHFFNYLFIYLSLPKEKRGERGLKWPPVFIWAYNVNDPRGYLQNMILVTRK